MASPEKIAPLPETLPEDFSDWDGEASSAPSRAKTGDWEAWDSHPSFGKSQRPVVQSPDRDAILESLIDRPAQSHSVPSAPAVAKQQRDISDWDGELSPAPRPTAAPRPASAPEPVSRNEWEEFGAPHSSGKSRAPLGQSADRDAILDSLTDSPRVSGSSSLSPTVVNQQNDSAPPVSEAAPAPESAPANRDEWEAFVEAPHSFVEKSPTLPARSADRVPILPPEVDKPPASAALPIAKEQNDLADRKKEAAPTAASAPVNRDEWEAFEAPRTLGKSQTPAVKSADRDAILPPEVEKPRVSTSTSPTAPAAKQQRNLTEWDREAPQKPSSTQAPSPTPGNPSEWEAFEAPKPLGKPQKPLGQNADRDALLPPVVDRPRSSGSAAATPTSPKPQKYSSGPVEVIPGRVSHTPVATYPISEVPSRPNGGPAAQKKQIAEPAVAVIEEAEEGHFPSFQSLDAEADGEKKAAKKKWMIIAVVSVCSMLLLLLLIGKVLQHGTKAAANQPVQPAAAASDTQPDADTQAPAAADPATQQQPPAAPARQQAADLKPSPSKSAGAANPAPVQAEMMNDQLTAPTQIPHEFKSQVAENEPPPESFGAAGADGLGGSDASGSVFSGQSKPVVKPFKPIVVSAGVVEGMLIQKSPPIYPSIARSARVSGTVKLEATISKTGAIKDLHVVSGPDMLRPAAMDAVRNWRYKPFKLNNEPVEIQSMINVVFTLSQ